MRPALMPFAKVLALLLAFCFLSPIDAAQESGDTGILDHCAWTLSQIIQFQLDESGRLLLKRDHWETAAKRPLDQEAKSVLSRRFSPSQEDLEPIEQLFHRLMAEAGSGGMSSSRRNMTKEMSWDGTGSDGVLVLGETEMAVSIAERQGENRRLSFRIQGEEIELTFLSPDGKLLQLLQSKDAVRMSMVWSGEPKVISGGTFAEIVHQNKDYFQNLEWPSFLGELPVAQALELSVKDRSEPGTFPAPQFSEATFLKEPYRQDYFVFTRFRIVDGRLRFNDFFGNADVLSKETETLSKEFGESLDRALQRMKDVDAPEIQIGQIRARFGAWQSKPSNEVGGTVKHSELLRAFEKLQVRAGSESTRSSMGGGTFRRSFDSNQISASISNENDALSFRVSDDPVNVDFVQEEDGFLLTASDVQCILLVREKSDGSAVLTLVHGDLCRVWSAKSWLDLVSENEAEFRERVVPILNHFAIEGLDPFQPEVIRAAVKRLQGELPETMDLHAVVGNSDSYLLPLLWNEKYLQLLAGKVAPEDSDLVKARLKLVSGK